jgi:pimeloyl-ACP methyl ester carboxylesterase
MTTESARIAVAESQVVCSDGLTMALDVHYPADHSGPLPLTIFVHGFKGFRRWGMFPQLARRLAAAGRACVTFDLSHNGVEAASPEQFTRLDLFEQQTVSRHVADLDTLLTALQQEDSLGGLNIERDIAFVVGHSLGGAVGILQAAGDQRVAGLACLNSVSHLRRVPEQALEQLESLGHVVILNGRTGQQMPLGRPWFEDIDGIDLQNTAEELAAPTLLLQGSADQNVTPAEGEALADWIPGNVYYTVPDGDHTFGAKHPWAGWTPALESVVEQLDAFLPATEG